MAIIAKIYPNGEASLYFERRLKKKALPSTPKRLDRQYLHYLAAEQEFGREFALGMQNAARRGGAPLGLVTAPISTKKQSTPTTTRGLTRLGARTLRQGAYLIDSACGKDCVTFGTATLPDITDAELQQVESDWSQIVDRFFKRLRYHLLKKGLPADVIHVTEVQPKRSLNEGREIPHIHFVFQGRKKKGSWAITPKQITKFWCKALQLKRITLKMCSTSCQLARVRKSVARYLSKYVAKNSTKTSNATSESNLRKLSLKQWWGISDSLRRSVRRNTRVIWDSRSEDLWSSHEKENGIIWEFMGTIKSTWTERDIIFCRFGRLTEWARQKYLRPNLGERTGLVGEIENIVKGLTSEQITGKIAVIDDHIKRHVQLHGCA